MHVFTYKNMAKNMCFEIETYEKAVLLKPLAWIEVIYCGVKIDEIYTNMDCLEFLHS